MPKRKAEAESVDLEAQLQQAEEIKQLRTSLQRAQKQLWTAKDKTETLRQALYEAAYDAIVALGPLPAVPKPVADKRKRSSETALFHLTDWQGSKVTPSYNTEIMKERVRLFMTKAERIVELHRTSGPVRDCTILFGGDMVEGLFNYPAQLWEIDSSLFEQWSTVSHLCAELVRWALSNFDNVNVVSEWGNHGRIGSKRDHVPRSDNIDRMVYEHARQMLSHEKRLTWGECPEDIQRVEIGNYRALLIHGDEVGRNGFASPTTLVNWANRQRSGAYPWLFRDIYIGHYHTHAEWAMANGEGTVYQTGSTESDNRYAGVTMAASAIPSQRVHFVDHEKGIITAQYKVFLNER